MGLKVSYSHAREHLAEIWNSVENTRDVAVIHRRGHDDMALIPADELSRTPLRRVGKRAWLSGGANEAQGRDPG